MKAIRLPIQISKIAQKISHIMMESTVLFAQISHPTSICDTRDAKYAPREASIIARELNVYRTQEAQFKTTQIHKRCMQTYSIKQQFWLNLQTHDSIRWLNNYNYDSYIINTISSVGNQMFMGYQIGQMCSCT